MTDIQRILIRAIVTATVVLLAGGCDVPLDATGELYSCEDDADCIDGYSCQLQGSGEYACALTAVGPGDVGGSDVADVGIDAEDGDTSDDAGESDASSECSDAETLCEGICVSTLSSTDHCGACGNACSTAGVGAASCVEGLCEYDACRDGFVDTDGDVDNGCECQLQNDGVELCNGVDDDCDGETDEDGLFAEQIAVGQYHACARSDQGEVYCWGQNNLGAIGDGTAADRTTPTHVALRAAAIDVTVGTGFSCAVLDDGSAWCWGTNYKGQLGDTTTTDRFEPVQVVLPGGAFQDIDAGRNHVCARAVVDGTPAAFCWGDNSAGQLGNGTTQDSTVPVEVPIPETSTWTDVSAGGSHSCGRVQGDATYCWGQNALGQLGNGETGGFNATPQLVELRSSVKYKAISAGGGHSCGIRLDDSLNCWGDNSEGELGTGDGVASASPVIVGDLSAVSTVSAGVDRTCAVDAGGLPHCWGANYDGELGTGDTDPHDAPAAVDSSVRFSAIEIYSKHACGIVGDGHVRCWGDGLHGRLGNGIPVSSATQVVTSCPQ